MGIVPPVVGRRDKRSLPRAVTPGALHAAVPLVIVGLWAVSISRVRLAGMTDIGLVSVLPVSAIVLLFALTLSFAVALSGQLRWPVLLAHVLVLIVVLYGVTAFVEPEPRFSTVWKHVGIMDYIARRGTVDPSIDAYFNWPGFFVLGAFITKAAGFGSPLAIAAWGPLVFNLLVLPPLFVLLRWATGDRRLVWLGLWVFYATNWVGQDYIAPQAVGFLLWLSVAAILITSFTPGPAAAAPRLSLRALISRLDARAPGAAAPGAVTAPSGSALQRIGLFVAVVAIFAATVTGHQLTPFAALLTVAGLTLFAGLATRGLPWLMAMMLGAWIGYMTISYLQGNIGALTKPIGALGNNLDQNVSNRLSGSPEHAAIAHIRLYVTAAIWLLAVAGLARRRLAHHHDTAFAVLAGAPLALPFLQAYGGEILLRVFLFALPAVAFFTACLVFPSRQSGGRWSTIAAVTVLSCLLLAAFQFTRYGNERLDQFTTGDVAAVQALYRLARPNATLVAGSDNIPWRYRDYAAYDYRLLNELKAWRRTPNASGRVIAELRDTIGQKGAYVIVTRSTKVSDELLGGVPGALGRLVEALRRARGAQELYRRPDGDIFFVRGASQPA
jgi:hypothetical protein